MDEIDHPFNSPSSTKRVYHEAVGDRKTGNRKLRLRHISGKDPENRLELREQLLDNYGKRLRCFRLCGAFQK